MTIPKRQKLLPVVQEAAALIARAECHFRIDPDLYDQVLRFAGEKI